jgi:starch phosphorylase
MKPIRTFTVAPSLPKHLEALRDLAYNLSWTWNHDTIELFRRLDQDLWEESCHNPLLMLNLLDQQKIDEMAKDDGFLVHFERVKKDYKTYLSNKTWHLRNYGNSTEPIIAYFSAEFGITECIPIYSGGLGMLAGDHLKSASALGLPLVGMGLLYQKGYFHQYLNPDGWQQEKTPENDFYNMPIRLMRNGQDEPLKIAVEYPGRNVHAQIWKAEIGRISLYLLDTNISENSQEDRDIGDQLYGGDNEMRIKQEILLGIGGIRALDVLGIEPAVCHMNEGHSAFLALERIRVIMEKHGLTFAEAREIAAAGNVFTTHTPVPAGHDYFSPELMKKYFGDYHPRLGLTFNELLGFGRMNPFNEKESFCMTILAIRLSAFRNGVAKLHGKVSRQMWQGLWPNVPQEEVPIGHVTNGVHSNSYISKEMAQLFDRYLGQKWREQPGEKDAWKAIRDISLVELWRTHEIRRERLMAFTRRRLVAQVKRRGGTPAEIQAAEEVLSPDALTIGFSRRFATYKRATLLLRDKERLKKLLCNPDRPVQIIFAGKAHPKDEPGKEIIREIVHFARDEEMRQHVVFIEDYDVDVARYLVQGVDVWLNTPIRPREASGTSGMKAAVNGALNLSILDGWWDEAYTPEVGWSIGRGEDYEDQELQDKVESEALYDVLEKDVIPSFYDRGRDGIPRRWVTMMRDSLDKLCPVFNTNRMVREYTEKFYIPTTERYHHLSEKNFSAAKSLAGWRSKVLIEWSHVKINRVEANLNSHLKVGNSLEAKAFVQLGSLSPEDVLVELYLGRLDARGNFVKPKPVEMKHSGKKDGAYIFETGSVSVKSSGRHGYSVRVMPRHPELVGKFETGLLKWAE